MEQSSTLQRLNEMISWTIDEEGKKIPKLCPTCNRPIMLREDKSEFCFKCDVIVHEDKKLGEEYYDFYQQSESRKQVARFKKYSLINKKLESASFDTFRPHGSHLEAQERVVQVCKGYANRFNAEKPVNLFLYGSYGTGKSHLAKSITDVVMEKGHSCLFISLPTLLTQLKSSYKNNAELSEFEILQVIANVRLLVLDDVGAEQQPDMDEREKAKAKRRLFEIFDSRAGKHTVITMNLSPQEFYDVYGERDASRVLEGSHCEYVPGENYRLRTLR